MGLMLHDGADYMGRQGHSESDMGSRVASSCSLDALVVGDARNALPDLPRGSTRTLLSTEESDVRRLGIERDVFGDRRLGVGPKDQAAVKGVGDLLARSLASPHQHQHQHRHAMHLRLLFHGLSLQRQPPRPWIRLFPG